MYSRCPSVRFVERFVELAEDSPMLSPIMNKASFSYLAITLVKQLYTPVLFNAFGFGNKASLVSAAIIDIVNVVTTLGKKIISFPWRFAWSWGPLGWLILGAW
ncbi:hypothetical protein WN944_010136 [Citrus x changshan-huyou]|uniref:Uncharacterized protein n=1 Tax=Citrus x changshan-huyou TaxID=2935761 RepID=A0AAP0MXD7_9ROSI